MADGAFAICHWNCKRLFAGGFCGCFCSGSRSSLCIFLCLTCSSKTLLSLLAWLTLLQVAALRPLGNTGLVEEAKNAIRRLGALLEPMLDAIFVQDDSVGVLSEHRVPGAQLFQEATVTRGADVSKDDVVVRTLLGACASKADLEGHCCLP